MAGLVHPLTEAANLGPAYRIGGSAALGALIAAAQSWMRYWAENPRRELRNPLDEIPRFLIAIFGSLLLLLVAPLTGFALLGVKPLPLAVPVGVIAGIAVIVACFYAFPGGPLGRSLTEVVLLGAVLAEVAATGTTSRSWLTDLVLLAVVLVATWQVPRAARVSRCSSR